MKNQTGMSVINESQKFDETTSHNVGDKINFRNIKTKRNTSGTIKKIGKKNGQTVYVLDGGKMVYASDLEEGYTILPPINTDKYGDRAGLEGPFSTRSGKVIYYDPKEGMYYDPDTDIYLSYDEWRELDDVPAHSAGRKEVDEDYGKSKAYLYWSNLIKNKKYKDNLDDIRANIKVDGRLNNNEKFNLQSIIDQQEQSLDEARPLRLKRTNTDYEDQMNQSHNRIYQGNQKPPSSLMKALRDEERALNSKKKTEATTSGDTKYLMVQRVEHRAPELGNSWSIMSFQNTPGSNPTQLGHMLREHAKKLGWDAGYDVIAAWSGDIDEELAEAQDKLTSGKKFIHSYQLDLQNKVKNLSRAKKYMSSGKEANPEAIEEAGRDPKGVINKFLSKKASRETRSADLAKNPHKVTQLKTDELDDEVTEASYKPGVTKLRREISFNDFDGHDGEEDYKTVKKIRWPSGIDVKFNDRNRTVTFYTAKMKTVAKILNKYIDFGAVSAGEILDLPPELMGEAKVMTKDRHNKIKKLMTQIEKDYPDVKNFKPGKIASVNKVAKFLKTKGLSDNAAMNAAIDFEDYMRNKLKEEVGIVEANEGQSYAVRAIANGVVIFGPYDSTDEAWVAAGPGLEAILPARRVAKKLRQKLDISSSVKLSQGNYDRMVGRRDETPDVNETVAKKPTKFDQIKSCPKCGGKIQSGYRGSIPAKRCTQCGWEKKSQARVTEAPDRLSKAKHDEYYRNIWGPSHTAQKTAQASANRSELAKSTDYTIYTKKDMNTDSHLASEMAEKLYDMYNEGKKSGDVPKQRLIRLRKAYRLLESFPDYLFNQSADQNGYGAIYNGKKDWDALSEKHRAAIVRKQAQIKNKKAAINDLLAKLDMEPIKFVGDKSMNEASYEDGTDDENTYTIINTKVNKRVGHGKVFKSPEGAERYLENQREFGKSGWDNPAIKVMSIADAKARGVESATSWGHKPWGFTVDEDAKEPYAIGMAQAKKATGDKPPLKKSTIKKAHKIAKAIDK